MLYQLVIDQFAIFYIVHISTNYEKEYSSSLPFPLFLLDGYNTDKLSARKKAYA